MQSYTGGCQCGAVRYAVKADLSNTMTCNCSRCRRHSGAAFLTQGRVRREDFRLLSGANEIRAFQPEDGAVKAFCVRCGSSLFGGTWPDGPEVSIRFGSLDGDPGIRPQYHTFVGSKAVWDDIVDSLPQYPEALPEAPRG